MFSPNSVGTASAKLSADIKKALELEQEFLKKEEDMTTLVLRFPDPELSYDLVKSFSSDIESVHFQQSCAPRYCFVSLKSHTNVDTAIAQLSTIPFGNGFITAELKRSAAALHPDDLDPYTLYVGNLPRAMATKKVKEYFPGAKRVDVGYAHRTKNTRFAMVQYDTVEAAMEAFKLLSKTELESRTLIVRFKRKYCKPFESKNPPTKCKHEDGAESCSTNNKLAKFPIAEIPIKREIVEETETNENSTVEGSLAFPVPKKQKFNNAMPDIKMEPFDIFEYFKNIERNNPDEPCLPPEARTSSGFDFAVGQNPQMESASSEPQSNRTKSIIRNLQNQVRRVKYTEGKPRMRDELDDLFAKMCSDEEDEHF